MKTTSENICFRLYFEEWLGRQNMYFCWDKLYEMVMPTKHHVFLLGQIICQRNIFGQKKCCMSTKLCFVGETCISTKYNCVKRTCTPTKLYFIGETYMPMQLSFVEKTCMPTQQHTSKKGIYADETKFCWQ